MAESTSLIFMVMPASASWAWITSASWTLIGMLLVVMVNAKPLGLPALGELGLGRARSRLMIGIALS